MGTIYRNGTAFIGSGGAGGVELTQAEYDALPTTEKMNGSIYFISDGEASYPSASTMRYDNSTSGLTATSVQAAVDEVNEKVNDNAGDIVTLNTGLASFEIRKVNFSYSIAANGNTHGNLYTLINNNMPSGYRFLAFAGFNTASVHVFMSNMRYVNSDYSIELRNVSNTTVTQTSDIFYLCAKI